VGNAFELSVDLSDEFAFLDALDEGARTVIRPAAQAGAQVYYDEVLRRVPIATKTVTRRSGKVIAPGALQGSIYQAFSADNSGPRRATYHISWNATKAPHGHLIENGHWTKSVGKNGPLKPKWVPAVPFIRGSYEAASDRALKAVDVKIDEGLVKVLARFV
jgi:hypothetical protein